MDSYSVLISTPVWIFVTLSETNDDLHQFSGELIAIDETGAMLRSGYMPIKWRFFPLARIARIESQ